ncbi:MAG: peptide deformylase [Candidatus Pacebacteria bacterium]|nr:peptide deformylase [Candidatus Paceibacterota bacterium]PIR59521.1 MAG: peptide deformylase [Candidatus Pacebacteria bacterium CG10_big_fil_rev_8_21_14_0_10_45_6]
MIRRTKTAPIVHIPHPALREVAAVVTEVDSKLLELSVLLTNSLKATRNPRGVGLAAPQIAVGKRMFAIQLEGNIKCYINPKIVDQSTDKILGPDGGEPRLEGCLSIPKIYGSVPRWEWIDLQYDKIIDGKLTTVKEHLNDFPARVAQHELDHLNGILFIDYSLTFGLPIYSENPETEDLELLAPEMLIALGAKQL